ncbi:MAG: hypothetical protein A4E49_00531 [Methanosaeta sp. PtaU1.Bin112]|nr:MAG: hypothetical protein A4E49_00531 [Methanosaeta sp. PtaU1.Bin112]
MILKPGQRENTPHPAVLISTISKDGIRNLMICSSIPWARWISESEVFGSNAGM